MRGRELHSEVLCGAVAPEAGGENGGRITLVDCALRLPPCEVDLGHGRHSVGRGRPAQAPPLLSAMRPVLLANGVSGKAALGYLSAPPKRWAHSANCVSSILAKRTSGTLMAAPGVSVSVTAAGQLSVLSLLAKARVIFADVVGMNG